MVRQFRWEMRTCGVQNGTVDDEVWSDGHEDLDWQVSRRSLQWGGSPSYGACCTSRPGPHAIGDGPMTVDPVFQAVALTENAGDLLLVTLCQVDVLLQVHWYCLKEALKNWTDKTEVEREKCLLRHHKNPRRFWKRRARARVTANLAVRDGFKLVVTNTPRSIVLSAVLIGAPTCSENGRSCHGFSIANLFLTLLFFVNCAFGKANISIFVWGPWLNFVTQIYRTSSIIRMPLFFNLSVSVAILKQYIAK